MGLEYRLDFLWADLSAVVEGIKGLCKGAFTTHTLASLTAFACSMVLVGCRVLAEGAFHLALLPFLCFYLNFPHFFDSRPFALGAETDNVNDILQDSTREPAVPQQFQ